MLTSPEWTRVAFVRNPYTRLASAFRDKIVNNHENRRPMQLRRNASADVNASEFLELLQRNWDPHWDHKVDEHWRPQASACLFEHVDVRIPKTKTCFVLKSLRTIPSFSATLPCRIPRRTYHVQSNKQLLLCSTTTLGNLNRLVRIWSAFWGGSGFGRSMASFGEIQGKNDFLGARFLGMLHTRAR